MKHKCLFGGPIVGDGTSIWGKSKGKFVITYASFDEECGSLSLSGPKTHWTHYTDRGIEKCLSKNESLKEYIRSLVSGKKLKKNIQISWSEQGMQPEHGWNFDVIFE